MKKKSGKALKKGPRNGGTIGVNHILTSMKENPAGAAIIWLVFLFITGIGNAVFGNQFGYCATAIKDTSRTTALKFVNAYYIHAAKFELTDIFVFPALLLVEVFIVLLWYSQWSARKDVDELKSKYKEALDLEKVLKNGAEENEVKDEPTVESLRERAKKVKQDIKDQLRLAKIFMWILYILSVYSITSSVFDLTLTLSSYAKVQRFHRSVAEVRPFITDDEFHRLNRQWVMMRSRDDYKAIQRQIADFGKRDESGAKPEPEVR